MRTKIQKWGNSLALRIPKSFTEEAEVEEGSRVDLSVTDGQFVIRPVRSQRFELQALLHVYVTTFAQLGSEQKQPP